MITYAYKPIYNSHIKLDPPATFAAGPPQVGPAVGRRPGGFTEKHREISPRNRGIFHQQSQGFTRPGYEVMTNSQFVSLPWDISMALIEIDGLPWFTY